ncbi:MAG: ATP-dependent sacrificial sulfur transferase LarE [Thermoplasmata archaeon]|nr:ATP-dependent sacrificial sulfur transferase LarE [Candidatus Sysuiplasma jiujiangense]
MAALDTGTENRLENAIARLRSTVISLESAVIGLSGGVDSALVAFIAREQLGDRAVAVTAISPSLSSEELESAVNVASEIGIRHLTVATGETEMEAYLRNDSMRCFHCKKELASVLKKVAEREGARSVLLGVNKSDFGDFRPGIRAAEEEGLLFPLAMCGIEKDDVRRIAGLLGLSVHSRPSNACLSSRIQYGQRLDMSVLRSVEEAERYIRGLGFRNVRVRVHDRIARVEIDAGDMERAASPAIREGIVSRLKALGFGYVVLDLEGFRSGSMNLPLRNSR